MSGPKLAPAASLACGLFLLTACREPPEPVTFVARVNEAYLMADDLDASLANLPSLMDSTEARRQIIDRWIAGELLYQEALRRGLADDTDVRRRLQDGERAVMVDALMTLLYEESEADPQPSQVRTYFEVHREQLRLREPFVRVRYLHNGNVDSVQTARRILRRTSAEDADSVFEMLTRRFSEDAALSRSLSENYLPESRMFVGREALLQRIARLAPGGIAPVFGAEDTYHLLQVVDRVPAGAIPELPWVEDQVRRQLTMDTRKQMYERQVQRLRMEALSREALVVN